MSIHLVTGYAGKEHITAADKGAYQAGVVGPGKYVLQSGNMFEAQVVSNNLIKVKDGDLLNQGRHIHIAAGDYEECTIENGTQSMKRNDIIVVRYTRNMETAVESAKVLVLKGTPGVAAVDPEYVTGNILNGDAVDDFPLYRVKLDGLNVMAVEPLFSTIVPYKTLIEKVGELNTGLGGIKRKQYIVNTPSGDINTWIKWFSLSEITMLNFFGLQGAIIVDDVRYNMPHYDDGSYVSVYYNATENRLYFRTSRASYMGKEAHIVCEYE